VVVPNAVVFLDDIDAIVWVFGQFPANDPVNEAMLYVLKKTNLHSCTKYFILSFFLQYIVSKLKLLELLKLTK
jgi:hypothetical protein